MNRAVVEGALRAIHEGAIGGGCIPRFKGRLTLWFCAIYPLMVVSMGWLLRQTGGACPFCTQRGFEVTGGFSEAHFAGREDVWVKAVLCGSSGGVW